MTSLEESGREFDERLSSLVSADAGDERLAEITFGALYAQVWAHAGIIGTAISRADFCIGGFSGDMLRAAAQRGLEHARRLVEQELQEAWGGLSEARED